MTVLQGTHCNNRDKWKNSRLKLPEAQGHSILAEVAYKYSAPGFVQFSDTDYSRSKPNKLAKHQENWKFDRNYDLSACLKYPKLVSNGNSLLK